MRTAAVLTAAIAVATPASAAIVTYELSGSEFTTCTDTVGGADCAEYRGVIGTSYDGTISLDLDALGLPNLANRTVEAGVLSGEGTTGVSVDLDFIGESFHDLLGASYFRLVTDGNADPVSWFVHVLGGPPDYYVSDDRMFELHYLTDEVRLEGDPGRLERITPAPIPLPAAGLLLAGPLGLFGMLGAARRG